MPGKRNSIVNPLALITAGMGLFYLSKKLRKQPASLEGQVVLITGGSRGLGLAIAEELSQQRK